MVSVLWALSSMFLLMLVIVFLPLGLSIKGKVLISVTSCIIAIGGLVAVVSFPMWQTALFLISLIFFVAYFMNKGMGTMIYLDSPVFREEVTEDFNIPLSYPKIDMDKVDIPSELVELKQTEEAPVINITDPVPSLPQVTEQKKEHNEHNLLDEDISFFLERGTENIVDEQQKEELQVGYLSDIESLLEEALVEEKDLEKRDWLEELEDLLPLDEVAVAKTDNRRS